MLCLIFLHFKVEGFISNETVKFSFSLCFLLFLKSANPLHRLLLILETCVSSSNGIWSIAVNGFESASKAKYGNSHPTLPRKYGWAVFMFVNSENASPLFRDSIYKTVFLFFSLKFFFLMWNLRYTQGQLARLVKNTPVSTYSLSLKPSIRHSVMHIWRMTLISPLWLLTQRQ